MAKGSREIFSGIATASYLLTLYHFYESSIEGIITFTGIGIGSTLVWAAHKVSEK